MLPCREDVTVSYDLGVSRYEKLWSPVILPAAVALTPWLGLTADAAGNRSNPADRDC